VRALGALSAVVLALACRGGEPVPVWTTEPRVAPTVEQDQLYFETLPALVIEVDAVADASPRPGWLAAVRRAQRAVIDSCSSQGAPACAELGELTEALITVASFPKTAGLLLPASQRRLNAALARARAPYYVETTALEMDGRHVVLALSFAIKGVQRFTFADGLAVFVVVLSRGDQLNWSHDLVGFTSEDHAEVVVLADTIEADIASALGAEVVPPWARAAMMELPESVGVEELRGLVRARRVIWDRLRARALETTLYELGEPRGLSSPIEVAELASRILDPDSFSELRELEDRIQAHPALPAFIDHLVTRTAVHEAQHRWDLHEGLSIAAPLRANHDADRDEVNAELSAYLAELSHAPGAVRSGVLRLIDQATTASPGSPERASASLILPALAGELQLSGQALVPTTWLADDLRAEAIASAARTLWQRWYARPLPSVGPG